MDSKMIFIDPDIELESEYFPNIYDVKIKSHGKELIGVMLTACGKGPHPTAILLHGFPGYEDNHDLAHALRRCGLNVLRFHYRGCWGVPGRFSFGNCIEDVKESINFIFNEDNIIKFRIDENNVFLVGHSMGGFLTLTNCIDERIKASVAISPYDFGTKGCVMKEDKVELKDGIEMFSMAIPPLNNTDTMTLITEAIDHGKEWDLKRKAKELSKKNILILGAIGDTLGPIKLHHIPLIKEIYKYSKDSVKEILVDTDHSYSNKRVWLARIIAEYIESIYNGK